MESFLRYLDQRHGRDKYTKYLPVFDEQDIDVYCLACMNEERLLTNYCVAEEGRRIHLIAFAREVIKNGMPK
jgi:hypothetical protein